MGPEPGLCTSSLTLMVPTSLKCWCEPETTLFGGASSLSPRCVNHDQRPQRATVPEKCRREQKTRGETPLLRFHPQRQSGRRRCRHGQYVRINSGTGSVVTAVVCHHVHYSRPSVLHNASARDAISPPLRREKNSHHSAGVDWHLNNNFFGAGNRSHFAV